MQRLAKLRDHLFSGDAAVSSGLRSQETAADPNEGLKLLTDRQLKDFLVDGVACIPVSELSTEWHEAFEKMHKGEVVKSVLRPV